MDNSAEFGNNRKPRGTRKPVGHNRDSAHRSRAGRLEELRGDHRSRDTQRGFVSASDESGYHVADSQKGVAALVQTNHDGHKVPEHLLTGAVAESGVDQQGSLAQTQRVDPALIMNISALWRQRRFWVKQEVKLNNAMFAYCLSLIGGCDKVDENAPDAADVAKRNESQKDEARRILAAANGKGEHEKAAIAASGIIPIAKAKDSIQQDRKGPDKQLAKLARKLPCAPWFESVYGVAIGSLGAIVGEAGDLSNYANPAKLHKRFGLAPYNGKSYASWKKGGLSSAEWTYAGYNPQRRSIMWNIGNGLIGGMGNGPRPLLGEETSCREDWSPYQKLFVDELRSIAELHPEHARPPSKDGKESFSKHAAAMAKRVVEKKFLVDLWVEWGRVNVDAESRKGVPVPDKIAA